jgi:MFS transporter, YNFM family, putative membrane transport protein
MRPSTSLGAGRLPTFPVIVAGYAAFVDLYATQPLLPLLARTFNASAFDVSLTVTAPAVAVGIAAPIVGRLADRVGLRRVIVGSAVAITVATALAATSTTLAQVIFWRFVQGVVTPGIFAAAIAYIHEVWPPTHAGRATAAYMTGTILGGFTGRAVAGVVAADISWPAAFVALAIVNAAVAVTLAYTLPDERAVTGRSARVQACDGDRAAEAVRYTGGTSRIVDLFKNTSLIATFAVGFCVLFTQVAMFTYVTFHLAAPPFNLSTVALGWLFVVYLVGAAVTPAAGRWIDAYGHRLGIGLAMGIGGVGALATLAPSLAIVIAGLAMCATGVFIAQATTSSYIGAVTTRDRALAVGLYSTFYYAGGSTGGVLPAALWTRGGWPACVALVVAVQAFGVAVAMTCWRGRRAGVHHEPEIEAVP